MIETDKARQLAMILQAIEEAEREMADYRASHKERMETLHHEAWKLRCEILSGQKTLPMEPETAA